MNKALYPAIALCLLAPPAFACPWAGGSFVGQFTNASNSRFAYTFDEACSTVRISRPTKRSEFREHPVVMIGEDYVFKAGSTTFRFAADGKSAHVTQGGRNLTARMRPMK